MVKSQISLIIIASLLTFFLFGTGCAPVQNLDSSLESIVGPYRFDLIGWQCRELSNEIGQWIFGSSEEIGGVGVVIEYFAAKERQNTLELEIEAIKTSGGQGNLASLEAELNMLQEQTQALARSVERTIERQIKETLAQLGIYQPMDNWINLEFNFPPINLTLEEPPHLLVISPRDRIDSIREIILRQDITLEEIESIEAAVDELGVSSLVVKLGGISTYPAFVTGDAGLKFTINTAIEEWLHQYLVFKPLGFLYALDVIGIFRNYEIAIMNETLAGMVSEEIGSIVYQKYYSQYITEDTQGEPTGQGFDFNQEMREIRRTVDGFLALGTVERAEQFMEQKRLYLAAKGYHIRKLNQAYFAFHGTYAHRPTSISPIGLELKILRSQSASVMAFLNKVAVMTSRQDLIDSIK